MTRLRKLAAAAGTVALLAFGPTCKHENPKKARKPAISAMKPEPEPKVSIARGRYFCPSYDPEMINKIQRTVRRQVAKNTGYFWLNGVDPTKRSMVETRLMVGRDGVVSFISVSIGGKHFSPADVGLDQLIGTNLRKTNTVPCFIVINKQIRASSNPPFKKIFENILKSVPCRESAETKILRRTIDSLMKLYSVYFWIRDVPHLKKADYTVLVHVNPRGRITDLGIKVHGIHFNYRNTYLARFIGSELPSEPGKYCHVEITGKLFQSVEPPLKPNR